MEIRYCSSQIEHFLCSLHSPVYEKTMKVLSRLEMYGNALEFPLSKPIGGGLFELRARSLVEVRMIYVYRGGCAVILHAFVKKSMRISTKDLLMARARLRSIDSL